MQVVVAAIFAGMPSVRDSTKTPVLATFSTAAVSGVARQTHDML